MSTHDPSNHRRATHHIYPINRLRIVPPDAQWLNAEALAGKVLDVPTRTISDQRPTPQRSATLTMAPAPRTASTRPRHVPARGASAQSRRRARSRGPTVLGKWEKHGSGEARAYGARVEPVHVVHHDHLRDRPVGEALQRAGSGERVSVSSASLGAEGRTL